MDSSTSGVIFASWIWLASITSTSHIIDKEVGREFLSKFIDRVNKYSEDHYLVCVALDPRFHGAGLSQKGIRKARSLALALAKKHVSIILDESGFILLYNEYMPKEGEFSDSCVRDTSTTDYPLNLWNDFKDS